MIQFFHPCDPKAAGRELWHSAYLHGQAESRNDQIAHWARFWSILPDDDESRPWAAPDLIVADTDMPAEPGEYRAEHYGLPIVCVLAWHHGGSVLGGRAAYEDDHEALKHVRDPQAWR